MNAPPASHRNQAILMLLLANLFWGLSFPLIKALTLVQAALLPESTTWFATSCVLLPRFTIGALVLAALCHRALRTLSRSEWKQGAGLGLLSSAGMILQVDGLQFVNASVSAFLTQFYAIMIPVWLAVRARRLPPWTVWVSCALVLAGVAVLGDFDWRELRMGRGELETLASSVFFMGQILWLDRKEFSGNRVLPVTTVMFTVDAAVAGVLVAFTAPRLAAFPVLWTSGAWLALTALLTVFCTLGAFTLMNRYQPRITATEAGLLYCTEPLFASLMALSLPGWFSLLGGFAYPNETVTVALLVGGGLITLANVLIYVKPPPSPGRAG